MALGSGFNNLTANDTFQSWLSKTNEMITMFRGDEIISGQDGVLTANTGGADTFGNARLNGEFASDVLIAIDELRGGDLFSGNSANLSITSNTLFTADAAVVDIENDLFVRNNVQVSNNLTVNTNSLFVGDVEAQSAVEIVGADSTLTFAGANQTFVWVSSNTHSSIKTSVAGSLILDADTGDDGTDSSIELKVDAVSVASFTGGGDIAFYSADGANTKVVWDATGEVLGINKENPDANVSLDVFGNTHTTDLVVENGIETNTITVDTSLSGVANLVIISNTDFSADVTVANNLTVGGTLSITVLDYTLVPDDYDDLIPNQTSGRLLGNTTNRWVGSFTDLDVSGTGTIETLTVQDLTIPANGTISFPANISFTDVTQFDEILAGDLVVTGNAEILSLQVSDLVTNTAAIIGTNDSVTDSSNTVIDQFPAVDSKGFKYIIHGENGDGTSAYAIEINCSHNGTDVFYTRFGEVSNNFDCDLTPQINGANVELVAVCPSAVAVTNVHSFNILRIETRNG